MFTVGIESAYNSYLSAPVPSQLQMGSEISLEYVRTLVAIDMSTYLSPIFTINPPMIEGSTCKIICML